MRGFLAVTDGHPPSHSSHFGFIPCPGWPCNATFPAADGGGHGQGVSSRALSRVDKASLSLIGASCDVRAQEQYAIVAPGDQATLAYWFRPDENFPPREFQVRAPSSLLLRGLPAQLVLGFGKGLRGCTGFKGPIRKENLP